SDDAMFARVTNRIIGSNRTALDAAEEAARELGYHVDRSQELDGEANDLGPALAKHMTGITEAHTCVIAGGEPSVTVRGGGKGGREQQAALAFALELARAG